MPSNLKLRSTIIALLLLLSSLSILVIPIENVKATEEDDFLEMFDFLLPQPFTINAFYEVPKDLELDGDMVFDLYFSNTLPTKFNYKDDVKITVSKLDMETELFFPEELENGNTTITLEPEILGDAVQKFTIKLENVTGTVSEGDFLLFEIEILQSDKPIGDFIAERFETKIKGRIENLADYLNESEDEDLKDIAATIKEIITSTEELGITSEEIADLANSFRSSSLVFNSKDYPSSIKLPIEDEGNSTLFINYDLYGELSEFMFYMNNEIPNGTNATWPTMLFGFDPASPDLYAEEWTVWIGIWLISLSFDGIPEEEVKKEFVYYLHENFNMSTSLSEDSTTQRSKISGDVLSWEGPEIKQNKIIENITTNLYLHYPKLLTLRTITVKTTLMDGEEEIASDEKDIDRTSIIELLRRGPDLPTIFTFNDFKGNYQIWNEKKFTLKVEVVSGPIFSLRPINIVYNSEEYPSSVTLEYEETTNIKIEGAEDKKVYAGGSTEYILNVTSKYKDDIDFSVEFEAIGDWKVEYYPESLDIEEDESVQVYLFVNSSAEDESAYRTDKIELWFNASGKTGFTSRKAKVNVSEDAVDHGIDIIIPDNKNIKHGESDVYEFIIKNNNTGFLTDDYDIFITSEHNWTLDITYDEDDSYGVKVGEDFNISVGITVPWYTNIESDILTIKVVSLKSGEKEFTVKGEVTTEVIRPNILESIYQFFESVAEDIGLADALGEAAGWTLIILIVVLILIFLIPILIIAKRRFIELICLDRIKDISPDEVATYEITAKNPYKRKISYDIETEIESSSDQWDVKLDTQHVEIEPRKSQLVTLTVKPTDYAKLDDWIETTVVVKPVDRKKGTKITTITSIKEGELQLKISGIFHWPRVFKKGDRVETTFRLENKGNVSAQDISVILHVNGKEENKVEDITIPRGGYAKVEIPWIAEKGKNEINIVVK